MRGAAFGRFQALGEWQEDAACRRIDRSPRARSLMFFPPEKAGDDARLTAEAKAVCAGCSVRAECLDYALAVGERVGVWGGLDEVERRRVSRSAS